MLLSGQKPDDPASQELLPLSKLDDELLSQEDELDTSMPVL